MLKSYKTNLTIDQKLKNIIFIFLSGIVMILVCCLELEVVNQPQNVPIGTIGLAVPN